MIAAPAPAPASRSRAGAGAASSPCSVVAPPPPAGPGGSLASSGWMNGLTAQNDAGDPLSRVLSTALSRPPGSDEPRRVKAASSVGSPGLGSASATVLVTPRPPSHHVRREGSGRQCSATSGSHTAADSSAGRARQHPEDHFSRRTQEGVLDSGEPLDQDRSSSPAAPPSQFGPGAHFLAPRPGASKSDYGRLLEERPRAQVVSLHAARKGPILALAEPILAGHDGARRLLLAPSGASMSDRSQCPEECAARPNPGRARGSAEPRKDVRLGRTQEGRAARPNPGRARGSAEPRKDVRLGRTGQSPECFRAATPRRMRPAQVDLEGGGRRRPQDHSSRPAAHRGRCRPARRQAP